MRKIFVILIFTINLLFKVQSVSPVFQQSDRYVRTGNFLILILGVFEITAKAFSTKIINNDYSVTFAGCEQSSDQYDVGLALYSLDIKFDGLRIQFDIQVTLTQVTGFTVNFQTSMGKLISLLKYCYIIQNPTYTDAFQIQNFRYTDSLITVQNGSPFTLNYDLTNSLPDGSQPTTLSLVFLTSFNMKSTVSGTSCNIDMHSSASFVDIKTIEFKLQTFASDVNVSFYSFTFVYYDQSAINAAGIARYTIGNTQSSVTDNDLFYDTTLPLQVFQYNLFVGLNDFYVAVGQIPNFLNFETTLTNDTHVDFSSTDNINWKFMSFQLLIIEAVVCPSSDPYYLFYMQDCVADVPDGFVASCNKDVILNLQLNLVYIIKIQWQNQIQILFDIEPSDPSFSDLLALIDWDAATDVTLDSVMTVVTQFIAQPSPQLKFAITYFDDINDNTITITTSTYDQSIYPVNFMGYYTEQFDIDLTSANNLAIQYYTEENYNMAQRLEGVFILLSCVYIMFFFIGFVAGKVYILQMVLVPQVTFLCILSLEDIAPYLQSISLLRYSFGFWYSFYDSTVYDRQDKNYLNLIGVADDFFLNCNVMFIFIVVNYLLVLVFHLTKKANLKKFFLYDTGTYLILWMTMWMLTAGYVEIYSVKVDSNDSVQQIFGIIFFVLWLLLMTGYFVLYLKFHPQFESFDSQFTSGIKGEDNSKTRIFYLALFIERFLLATIIANAFSFNYLNIIVAFLSLITLILIIVFKPYKFKINGNTPRGSPIRPNVRQIINYSILIIIQILLFSINLSTQSSFDRAVPIIIIILLIISIFSTLYFLIFDDRMQMDFAKFKSTFGLENKSEKSLKKGQQKTKQKYQNIEFDILQSPSQRDALIYKKQSLGPNPDAYQSKLRANNRMINPNENISDMSIDQQIMKVAQNNRKKLHQGNIDYNNAQVSKIKSYHSIMKDSNTPKKGSSYQKHSDYFVSPLESKRQR